MPGFPIRRSLRLKEYDYSQSGAYFVTLCTYERESLFRRIVDYEMKMNAYGVIADECWRDLPSHYPGVSLDVVVVMPNHLHGIVWLSDEQKDEARTDAARTKQIALPEVIRGFKTFSARKLNEMRQTRGVPVWQRNYYEHVVRDEPDLTAIREYIVNNPAKWAEDRYYVAGPRSQP
ncbi:MAG: transposase [Chloroflexi bacterium]|nr:transposase [Chloroflexota bacterium]